MKTNITISDLKNTACAGRNQHLFATEKKQPAPRRSSKALDWLELNLQYWANENSLALEKEYLFAEGRKYRSDWAIESLKLLIEFEGGVFMARGGHNSPTGIQRDIDKYQLAHKLGFTVIRLTAINYMTVLKQLNELKHG